MAAVNTLAYYITLDTEPATGSERVFIYKADGPGGYPGTLMAKSNLAVATFVQGWNQLDLTAPITLDAGDYYLGVALDVGGSGYNWWNQADFNGYGSYNTWTSVAPPANASSYGFSAGLNTYSIRALCSALMTPTATLTVTNSPTTRPRPAADLAPLMRALRRPR
jgi:hypothetical protein